LLVDLPPWKKTKRRSIRWEKKREEKGKLSVFSGEPDEWAFAYQGRVIGHEKGGRLRIIKKKESREKPSDQWHAKVESDLLLRQRGKDGCKVGENLRHGWSTLA